MKLNTTATYLDRGCGKICNLVYWFISRSSSEIIYRENRFPHSRIFDVYCFFSYFILQAL